LSSGSSILALHGFTGCGEDFSPFFPLCRSLAAWQCPNLPGHGPAPAADCSPSATVDFIESARARLCPEPEVLLGYSAGARAALLHAVAHPRRWHALILISPNPGIEDPAKRAERRAVDEKLAQRVEKEGAPAFIGFWQQKPMIRSQLKIRSDWRTEMLRNRAQHTAEGLAASLRNFGQGSCPNLWPSLKQIEIPVLLIAGAEDRKYSELALQMGAQLPNGRVQIIDGAGHMPHLEQPESSAGSIDRFIEGIDSGCRITPERV